MGWWKATESGQIDWSAKPTGHPGNALINAIPQRDSTEDYYNGDGPADVMGVPISFLKVWFKDHEDKPTTNDLTELWVNGMDELDPRLVKLFAHVNQDELHKLRRMSWEMVDNEYIEAWGRPAYPEERRMVDRFVFGGASSKWKDEFWKLRARDKKVVENANKGIWGLG